MAADRPTVVHLKRELFDVDISRNGPWGNPFKIGRDGDRDQVIAEYREWVLRGDDPEGLWIREHIGELRGKRLGCWCAPKACHGDVLADLAVEL